MLVTHAFRIGRLQCAPGTQLGPRKTVPYEFVRILKGNVRWDLESPDGFTETHELGPGAFILSHPGTVERYRWDPEVVTQHDFVHFHLGELPDHYPAPDRWKRVQQIDPQNVLNALFQQVLCLNRAGHPHAKTMVKKTVEQMLDVWVHGLHGFEETGLDDFTLPVKRVLDLVRNRWENRVYRAPSLEDMVACSRVSRWAFLDAFKQDCQASPGAFFEHQRLYLARLHLLETNRTIDEIAHRLGYPNPFQLSRNFKQIFQLSPRHYRDADPIRRPEPRSGTEGYAFQSVFETLSMTQAI
ncbi:MAG: helix-turn-helix transcriptional regulator [Planctomycetota bacterium]